MGGGGTLEYYCCTYARPEKREKDLLLRQNTILENRDYGGQNVPTMPFKSFQEKRVYFGFYYEAIRSHFSNSSLPLNMFPYKSFKGYYNWVQNSREILQEERVSFSNLTTSGHASVQH